MRVWSPVCNELLNFDRWNHKVASPHFATNFPTSNSTMVRYDSISRSSYWNELDRRGTINQNSELSSVSIVSVRLDFSERLRSELYKAAKPQAVKRSNRRTKLAKFLTISSFEITSTPFPSNETLRSCESCFEDSTIPCTATAVNVNCRWETLTRPGESR